MEQQTNYHQPEKGRLDSNAKSDHIHTIMSDMDRETTRLAFSYRLDLFVLASSISCQKGAAWVKNLLVKYLPDRLAN